MSAQEQWQQIERTFRKDFTREIDRNDWQSAEWKQTADFVDTSMALCGVLMVVIWVGFGLLA